jgi:uncharacterized protein
MANRRLPKSRPPDAIGQARAVRGAGDALVLVAVRVKPGAGRTRVGGCHGGPQGSALVIAVSARAVDGKATEAVRRALADALGLRAAAVVLRLGATSRDKVFSVTGDVTAVEARVGVLRDGAA